VRIREGRFIEWIDKTSRLHYAPFGSVVGETDSVRPRQGVGPHVIYTVVEGAGVCQASGEWLVFGTKEEALIWAKEVGYAE